MRALASAGMGGFFGVGVDQAIEIGQAAQRLGGDGLRMGAIDGEGEVLGGDVERRLQRQAAAEHGVEQAHGGAAGFGAGRFGLVWRGHRADVALSNGKTRHDQTSPASAPM